MSKKTNKRMIHFDNEIVSNSGFQDEYNGWDYLRVLWVFMEHESRIQKGCVGDYGSWVRVPSEIKSFPQKKASARRLSSGS